MVQLPLLATVSICLLPFCLPAQDDAAATPEPPSPREVLNKAIQRMAKINGVGFRTTETQNSVMSRNIAKQMGGAGGMLGGGRDVAVRGSWSDGILRASINDDADEMLSFRGRMVARNDDVSWKLRRNRTASGSTMPFVLDPGRFFEALQALPKGALQVKNSKASTYKDKDVLIVGLTLEGENAQDFALSGALPSVSSGMGGGMMMVMRGMGGGAGTLPELTVDLSLYIEPTTGYIHKIKSRSYQESQGGGGVQIQVRGGGGFGGGDDDEDEEEEKIKEKDEAGKRIYKRGLPVRDLGDNLSRMSYDVVFTKHDQAVQKKIAPRAKTLLRIPN
jgi:hypothetical protein